MSRDNPAIVVIATRAALARAARVSVDHLDSIAAGRRSLTADVAEKVASAAGVRPSEVPALLLATRRTK